jgi:multicomponent Na+:H+ antiporter subunit G
VGVAFDVVGCLGLVRLPDVYNRMQAATKCVALGTLLIVAGAVVTIGTPSALAKGGLCLAFLLLTSPTGSHALARAAHRSGTRLWEGSLLDQLADDEEGRR